MAIHKEIEYLFNKENAISFMSLMSKLAGLFLVLFGIFMVKYLPGVSDYQPSKFSWTGIVIGAITFLYGIYLLAN